MTSMQNRSVLAGAMAEARENARERAALKAEERRAREAAEERREREERETPTPSAPAGSPQDIARALVPASQWTCLNSIITRESGWNPRAVNPSSGAYGLPQALPGHKMSSAGPDWRTNPATQIRWALSYMNDRYGSPCGAWSFWQSHHWY